MTNGDYIRSLSDEDLAQFIAGLMARQRSTTLDMLQKIGVPINIGITESPMLAAAEHLKWLKEPMKEGNEP